jgi:hypothetical protein
VEIATASVLVWELHQQVVEEVEVATTKEISSSTYVHRVE